MAIESNPTMRPEHHTPRRYEVRHETAYTYDDDVTASYGRACLRPRLTPHQAVQSHDISIEPEPDVLGEHVDFFGNFSHYVEILRPHQSLVVTKRSVVEVDWPAVDLDELDAFTVASAAERLRTDPLVDPVEAETYLLPSPLVSFEAEVHEYASSHLWPDRPLGEAILALTRGIYSDFRYTKGATTTKTTLPEIITSREGVCQDFAHLASACLRVHGLPARYVSGYIETVPPPGKPKLAGSDATHAWTSVMVPRPGGGSMWVDLDPTNDHLADSRYIVTAWGRDFRDVSPLKGVIFTESKKSTLKVGVDVIRLPD
ncbi:transglutaminase family protein [Arsenicicoccus piscis]|uniref:transglutaminase family protein n=1 Tax=Arsenicicoccus piscis TaxID=673954 RepID=UPI001F4CDE7C|nr:transglutaminase family protein [Arsenicicoccus piscis]MCH8626748.1 transglutaminase family protein [Arsenicicoccus piscis]